MNSQGPIPSPTREKLLPRAGSLARCVRVQADAAPRPTSSRASTPGRASCSRNSAIASATERMMRPSRMWSSRWKRSLAGFLMQALTSDGHIGSDWSARLCPSPRPSRPKSDISDLGLMVSNSGRPELEWGEVDGACRKGSPRRKYGSCARCARPDPAQRVGRIRRVLTRRNPPPGEERRNGGLR
jgi:hypothetical protein